MAKTTKKTEEDEEVSLIGKLNIDESIKKNLLIYLKENYPNKYIDDEYLSKKILFYSQGSYHLKTVKDISDTNEGDLEYGLYIGPSNQGNKRHTNTLHFISDFESEIKEKLIKQEIESQSIYKQIENLLEEVNKLKNENNQIKDLMFSSASRYNDVKTTQTLPINIYLDTNKPEEIFEVYSAILKFISTLGFEKAFEFEPVKGSWYKRILAKSKEKLTSQDVLDRLKEAEYGIEVNTILKQQSEIDKNQSEALANIITSLKDIPNAAIRVGALIVVKLTNDEGSVSLQTRTLSIKELHLLNKKPELLQMPKQILQALAKEIEDDDTPKISEN